MADQPPPTRLSRLTIQGCPAPSSWFEPRPEGKHCARCRHTVVDLSGRTEDEAQALVRARTSAGERVCVSARTDPRGRVAFRNRVGAMSLTVLAGCAPWADEGTLDADAPTEAGDCVPGPDGEGWCEDAAWIAEDSEACAPGQDPQAMSKARPAEPWTPGNASIVGVIRNDRTGMALPEVRVVVMSSDGARNLETTTDERGVYAVRNLPPGAYIVQAQWGEAVDVKNVTVGAKARARANFRLDPDVEYETVGVLVEVE